MEKKSNTPLSIILIWSITAFAVLITLIALLGVLISRQEKLKRSFISGIEKIAYSITGREITIGDIDISLFPLNTNIKTRNIRVDDVLKIESFELGLGWAEIEGIIADNIKIASVNLRGKNIIAKGVRIKLDERQKGGNILSQICRYQKIMEKYFVIPIRVEIFDVEVILPELEVLADAQFDLSRRPSGRANLSVDVQNQRINERIYGYINLEGNNISVIAHEPIYLKAEFDARICTKYDVFLKTQGKISVESDLEKLKELELKAKGKVAIKADIDAEIMQDGNLFLSGKGNVKASEIEMEEILYDGTISAQVSWSINKSDISVVSSIEGPGVKKLIVSANYKIKEKRGSAEFFGEIEMNRIPIAGLSGLMRISGNTSLPIQKFAPILVKTEGTLIKYDIINVDRISGNLKIKPEGEAEFDLIADSGQSQIKWSGKLDTQKKEILVSDIRFERADVKDILKMIKVKLPIYGASEGSVKLNMMRRKIKMNGQAKVENAYVFGEKIKCVLFNMENTVMFDGNFKVNIYGSGMDSEEVNAKCNSELETPSSVDFITEITPKWFYVMLSGEYELDNLEIAGIGMRGDAKFSGEITGNLKGSMTGKIDVSSQDVYLKDYPIRTSCVIGNVSISEDVIAFNGNTCEGFITQVNYDTNKDKLFTKAWRDKTEVVIDNDILYGEGDLSEAALLIPEIGDNEGHFKINYDINKRMGDIIIKAERAKIFGAHLQDLSMISKIKGKVANINLTAKYTENKIKAEGTYNTETGIVSIEIEPEGFLNIPLEGSIRITGQPKNPNVIGKLKVSGITIQDTDINNLKTEISSLGSVESDKSPDEKKGNINLNIEIKDVVYETLFFTLLLDGVIYVTGELSGPKTTGVLKIRDGTFEFAGTEFRRISGTALLKDEEIIVNISASSEIITFENEKFLITAKIMGNIKSPSVRLSSTPSIPERDIICILAVMRRCESAEHLEKILESMIYRNISFMARRLEREIGVVSNIRPVLSPSEVGISGDVEGLKIKLTRRTGEDITSFFVSKGIGENIFLDITWDDRKYGISILGNFGNLGMDIRLKQNF